MARILVVDDDRALLELVCSSLRGQGHKTAGAITGNDALAEARRLDPSLALLDLKLPDLDGISIFQTLRTRYPGLIGILMSGYGTFSSALEGGRRGIARFVEKPFRIPELVALVEDSLVHARTQVSQSANFDTPAVTDGMIGTSAAMEELFRRIAKVALLDYPVLILGESGTGKELVARAIHQRSHRSDRPFIDLNCAAIPPGLFEAEFFGHERGAFTDAAVSRSGWFEQAHRGTLFLDEIGDLSLEGQAKLLRVIEDHELRRLGGRQTIPVDVRILAATNVDLVKAIARGAFREDLYWRLSAATVRVPPVRERDGDLELLLGHFLRRVRVELGNPKTDISPDARLILLHHSWPGNVREIEQTIREAGLSTETDLIRPENLPPLRHSLGVDSDDFLLPDAVGLTEGLSKITEQLEREWIRQALLRSGGSKAKAAELLKIDPRTLYTKMRALGLHDRI